MHNFGGRGEYNSITTFQKQGGKKRIKQYVCFFNYYYYYYYYYYS